MKRLFAVLVALSALAPATTLAASLVTPLPVNPAERHQGFDTGTEDDTAPIQVHYGPVFLGCVYSYHECEHLGHARGFYNHFTRHDHRICHHGPSYACYGR